MGVELDTEKLLANRDKANAPLWSGWKVDSEDIHGEAIKNITGSSKYYCVYFVKNDWLKWQYEASCIDRPHLIEAESQILLNRGKSLLSADDLRQFKRVLSQGLVHAFNDCRSDKDHKEFFKESRAFLTEKSKAKFKLTYFLVSTFFVAVLSTIFATVYFTKPSILSLNQLHFLAGASMGAVGAFLSNLLRFDEISKNLAFYSGSSAVVVEGLTRVGLGFGFGGVLVICVKADIILGIANSNQYLIMLGGVVAGVNERFVPSLLAQVEGTMGYNGN